MKFFYKKIILILFIIFPNVLISHKWSDFMGLLEKCQKRRFTKIEIKQINEITDIQKELEEIDKRFKKCKRKKYINEKRCEEREIAEVMIKKINKKYTNLINILKNKDEEEFYTLLKSKGVIKDITYLESVVIINNFIDALMLSYSNSKVLGISSVSYLEKIIRIVTALIKKTNHLSDVSLKKRFIEYAIQLSEKNYRKNATCLRLALASLLKSIMSLKQCNFTVNQKSRLIKISINLIKYNFEVADLGQKAKRDKNLLIIRLNIFFNKCLNEIKDNSFYEHEIEKLVRES